VQFPEFREERQAINITKLKIRNKEVYQFLKRVTIFLAINYKRNSHAGLFKEYDVTL
jgi:hypothetical protein